MATKFLSPEAQFRAGVNMREELGTEAGGAGEASRAGGSPNVGPRFSGAEAKVTVSAPAEPEVRRAPAAPATRTSEFAAMRNQEDAPPCSTCGSIMIRSGSCYKCANCGTTSGCA
jgi:ribonucleoside-diphosphate reductase alpha chain